MLSPTVRARLFAAILVLLQGGCASPPSNDALLSVAGQTPEELPITSPDEAPYRIVTTYFATDREVKDPRQTSSTLQEAFPLTYTFTSTSKRDLTYGIARVSIPITHTIGQIERPKFLERIFKEKPEKYLMLQGQELVSAATYFSKVQNAAHTQGGQATRRAFIFIHGYNVSFEDAAFRTAQIAYDLDVKFVPVFYSWHSRGDLEDYTRDWASSIRTRPKFQKFLADFADKSGIDEIFVLAHSLGTSVATEALSNLLVKREDLRPRFKQLILAAADIDEELFMDTLQTELVGIKLPTTLYVNKNDRALKASAVVRGDRRVGLRQQGYLEMVTVDASKLSTDFLGHSAYAASKTLLKDIKAVFTVGAPPGGVDRHNLKKVSVDPAYWTIEE